MISSNPTIKYALQKKYPHRRKNVYVITDNTMMKIKKQIPNGSDPKSKAKPKTHEDVIKKIKYVHIVGKRNFKTWVKSELDPIDPELTKLIIKNTQPVNLNRDYIEYYDELMIKIFYLKYYKEFYKNPKKQLSRLMNESKELVDKIMPQKVTVTTSWAKKHKRTILLKGFDSKILKAKDFAKQIIYKSAHK